MREYCCCCLAIRQRINERLCACVCVFEQQDFYMIINEIFSAQRDNRARCNNTTEHSNKALSLSNAAATANTKKQQQLLKKNRGGQHDYSKVVHVFFCINGYNFFSPFIRIVWIFIDFYAFIIFVSMRFSSFIYTHHFHW